MCLAKSSYGRRYFYNSIPDGGVDVVDVLHEDLPARGLVGADVAPVRPGVRRPVPPVVPRPVVLQQRPLAGPEAAVGALEALDALVHGADVPGQVVNVRSLVRAKLALRQLHVCSTFTYFWSADNS